jgi:hypothetical protein
MTGDDNLYDEDRPAKPPKPQPPKPPAPPPPPMVEVKEALALIAPPVEPADPPPPPDELTGLLPVWLRDREASRMKSQGPRAEPEITTPVAPAPRDPCSDTAAVGRTTTGALGEVIRHCFGNYAQWRKLHQSPE